MLSVGGRAAWPAGGVRINGRTEDLLGARIAAGCGHCVSACVWAEGELFAIV